MVFRNMVTLKAASIAAGTLLHEMILLPGLTGDSNEVVVALKSRFLRKRRRVIVMKLRRTNNAIPAETQYHMYCGYV